MSEYKILDEWFPDGKPDGRKFVNKDFEEYVYFQPYYKDIKDGWWHGLDNGGESACYSGDVLWNEYVPPKKTKKITMYKPVYFCSDRPNKYITSAHYSTSKSDFSNQNRIVGWMTMEADVDE